MSLGVDGWATATIPEAAEPAVRSGVIDANLLRNVGRIVTHHPTMIRTVIAVRSKGHIDHAIEQRERGPAMRTQGIPKHMARSVIVAGSHAGIIRGADDIGTVETGLPQWRCVGTDVIVRIEGIE